MAHEASSGDPRHDLGPILLEAAPPALDGRSVSPAWSPDDGRTADAPAAASPQMVDLTPQTMERAGALLFTLWLKIGATLIAARLVVHIWPVIVLLILSLMLVATFSPLVRRLQSWLGRSWAITAVVFGLVAAGAGLLLLMIPPLLRQAHNLLVNLPRYLAQIEAGAHRLGIPLHLHGSQLDLSRKAASLGPEALNVLGTVFSGVTGVLTVAVLTIYLLIDGPRVGTGLFRLLPRHQRLHARQMFGEIGQQVGSYMRGQLLTSAMAGLFAYVLLLACRVPEPLALAFWMAIADAVPMVGPLIGTVPAVLLALTRGTPVALIVLLGYVIYHQVESHVLVPRIYGTAMHLSSSVVVIAILIGATLMGILGALLALPVAAAVPVVLRYVQEWNERDESDAAKASRALP